MPHSFFQLHKIENQIICAVGKWNARNHGHCVKLDKCNRIPTLTYFIINSLRGLPSGDHFLRLSSNAEGGEIIYMNQILFSVLLPILARWTVNFRFDESRNWVINLSRKKNVTRESFLKLELDKMINQRFIRFQFQSF